MIRYLLLFASLILFYVFVAQTIETLNLFIVTRLRGRYGFLTRPHFIIAATPFERKDWTAFWGCVAIEVVLLVVVYWASGGTWV